MCEKCRTNGTEMKTETHSPEALKFVVYTSNAVTRFYADDLEQLLVLARAHNHSVGISGILLYKSHRFIQFLEGPPGAVDALMERISRDPRHTDVRVVVDDLRLDRQFQDWSMGYQVTRDDAEPLPEGFRDSFADIEAAPDSFTTGRAAKELALWFRVRSARAARAAAA
ncbi:BLUF domain-containing protein [Leucobacter musarum]|uniref:BLUF domain-containing protein n=1 Tax=Leucobacter musarum TaxID=1930747 RepID=UPI001EFBA588|nr:BLUF domain-containing protein [Leucobacter musarum]